jgi:hypothetical protein
MASLFRASHSPIGYQASGDRSRPRGHAIDRAIGKLQGGSLHGVAAAGACLGVAASCAEGFSAREAISRSQDERACRGTAVVSLAPKKRLCLNVRRKRLLVSPFGKKSCDINERHNPF